MFEPSDSILGKLRVSNLAAHDSDLSDTTATHITAEKLVTRVSTAGAETRVLDNAPEGTIKIIVMTVYVGACVITPLSIVGSTITLDAVGELWAGIFIAGEWKTLFVASYPSTATVA
jgi:hypothetical protein